MGMVDLDESGDVPCSQKCDYCKDAEEARDTIDGLAWRSIEALFLYWYNTDPKIICKALYKDPIGCYLDEKVALYARGLIAFWGQLDTKHQQKLIKLATAKYAEEVQRRWDLRD